MVFFKKIFSYIILFIGVFFIIPGGILAIENCLIVNDENIYVDSGVNSMFDGTVVYDADTNTLTLNNYNGGLITSDLGDILNINLIGSNVVTGSSDDSIGIYSYNDLVISGDGSLEINDVKAGIVNSGKIKINDGLIVINAVQDGLYVDNNVIEINSDVIINSQENGISTEVGDVVVNGDVAIYSLDHGIYTYNGDVTVNGNVYIASESSGFYINGLLSIDGGISLIKAEDEGIFADTFTMNDGIIRVTSVLGGIGANSSININGGYLSSKVSEGGYAIAVLGSGDIEFNINPDMIILPDGISLQEDSLEIFSEVINGISLGEEGASIGIDFENFGYLLDKIAYDAVIKESDSKYGEISSQSYNDGVILSSNLSEIIPLNDDERFIYENGGNLSIILSMSDSVSSSDDSVIKDNLGDNVFLKSFDISLSKKIGSLETEIHDLNGNIKLGIKLDDSFINNDNTKNRVYKVLRNHNGEVSVLDAYFDANTNYLSFETDKFSSYALVYKDYDIISNPSTSDNISIYFSICILSMFGLITNMYLKKKNS